MFFPLLEACRSKDRERMNELTRPLTQRAVFEVASLWHTALALGRDTVDQEEMSALREYPLVEAVPYNCHPGGLYGQIVRGHNVLYELLIRECTVDAERDCVQAFRRHETQVPPDDQAVYRSLRRRLLVTEAGGQWRLRVPLMARWLRERG